MPRNTVSPLRIQEVGIDLFIQPALRAAAEQLIALAKAEAERATAANAGNLSQRFLILAREILRSPSRGTTTCVQPRFAAMVTLLRQENKHGTEFTQRKLATVCSNLAKLR
jgi:hypothetical protein